MKESFKLIDGKEIPTIGFGTWQTPDGGTAAIDLNGEYADMKYCWDVMRYLADNYKEIGSENARTILARYLEVAMADNMEGKPQHLRYAPSKLHSCFMMIATRMATEFADFHFVGFMNRWGWHNLRKEDYERFTDAKGVVISSLVERIAKAYAYSRMLHPEERLPQEIEAVLAPYLKQKGYHAARIMFATMLIDREVKGRKMKFVKLIGTDGEEAICEIHKLTAFGKMRYADIPNTAFRVILRNSAKEDELRVEAAVSIGSEIHNNMECQAGWVDAIDVTHGHIHIYGYDSRHYVSSQAIKVAPNSMVAFVPLIPKHSRFKSAIIIREMHGQEAIEAFGAYAIKITLVDQEKKFCAWKLCDESAKDIVEGGTTEPSYREGFISFEALDKLHIPTPTAGSTFNALIILKRGKDGIKRPRIIKVI